MASDVSAALAWRQDGAWFLSSARPTIGLIGVGEWGSRLLHQFTALGAHVVCYAGRTEVSRGRVEAGSPTRTVDSIDELLSDTSVGAVAIATPPDTHANLAGQVLAAGKHVFVEKPLCLTMADLERVLNAAEDKDRVVFTGYTIAYHPVVTELARRSREGELQSIWSYKSKTGSFSSDVVSTLLVHDLAALDKITGGVRGWSICGLSGPTGNPDAVTLAVESTVGAGGIARVDRVSPVARRELAVWIDDRLYRWNGGTDLMEFAGGEFRTVYSASESALEVELKEFLNAVARGAPDQNDTDREQRLAELTILVRNEVLS